MCLNPDHIFIRIQEEKRPVGRPRRSIIEKTIKKQMIEKKSPKTTLPIKEKNSIEGQSKSSPSVAKCIASTQSDPEICGYLDSEVSSNKYLL